ncbi:hypothetical protein FIC87_12660 [Eggerthella lenta]|uniref:Phage protein Gp19/Gp15/Gp42 n=1 Tax=Eggerthella lenta TaxID=84112 RepID=A0A5C5BS30_EGGLN|nr:Gp19/Gp15/Gp42 family protein [Eggerthella lenta]TNU89045.1 hypothetical protein FIC87_12660 [Eggerthella lenta]
MKPFATPAQYEARYGDVDEPELLAEVLMDATRLVASALGRAGIDYADPSEEFADRLMQACRSMAHRAMGGDAEIPAGATQFSEGAGSYTQSFTIGNPYGELYVSKAERRLLGLDGARAGFCVPGGAS